jgi:hypothetical protein
MEITGDILGILLKACSVPYLPRIEPNYPQSYPQFRWRITLAGLTARANPALVSVLGLGAA